jgi:hypothetical protein
MASTVSVWGILRGAQRTGFRGPSTIRTKSGVSDYRTVLGNGRLRARKCPRLFRVVHSGSELLENHSRLDFQNQPN